MLLMSGSRATEANIKAAVAPFVASMSKFPDIKATTPTITTYKTYKEWFDHEFGMAGMDMKRKIKRDPVNGVAEPNGLTQLDSRILGARHFKSSNLSSALQEAMPAGPLGQLRGNFVTGPGVALHASTKQTSVNPAWRNGLTHLIASGLPGDWNVNSLRKLAPDSGAYGNECSWNETDWKTAFWGENYSKLSSLKTKYDPGMVFWATPGINADLYEVRDQRVCTVSAPKTAMAMTIADRGTMPPINDNTNTNNAPENDEGTTILNLMPWDDIVDNIFPGLADS
jgi:Berberine and berberine like